MGPYNKKALYHRSRFPWKNWLVKDKSGKRGGNQTVISRLSRSVDPFRVRAWLLWRTERSRWLKYRGQWAALFMLTVKVLAAQSYLTLCNPMDWSFCPWDSPDKNSGVSCHSLLHRNWTWVSCIAGGFFTIWATREACICWGLSLSWEQWEIIQVLKAEVGSFILLFFKKEPLLESGEWMNGLRSERSTGYRLISSETFVTVQNTEDGSFGKVDRFWNEEAGDLEESFNS